MKLSIITLFFVFALSSCKYLEYSDLEGVIDKDRIIECIRGCEPIIEDIVEIIQIVQEKQWPELLTVGAKVLNHVREALDKCPIKKEKEVNLEGLKKFKKRSKKFKKGIKIGKDIYKTYKIVKTLAPVVAAVAA